MRKLRISQQLTLGFAILMVFVLILAGLSYYQARQLHEQTVTLYEHPLLVRRAIGALQSDIFSIHRDLKDMCLTVDNKEREFDLRRMGLAHADVEDNLEILYGQYLGPRADLDSVKKEYLYWQSMREETLRLLRAGKTEEAAGRTKTFGIAGLQVERLLSALNKVDTFAKAKADELHKRSMDLSNELNMQLTVLVVSILLLSVLIITYLLRTIRTPLRELNDAARRFHAGDMQARCGYALDNEFGILSHSFNVLAEGIQHSMDLNGRTVELSGAFQNEDDANRFFHAALGALSSMSGSQVAAAYLLSDDKKTFECFESIGAGVEARRSFDAGTYEGEIGAALASRRILHVKQLPDDTRFVFHTASGSIVSRELITIPVISSKEVIAIISLATVGTYSPQFLQLLDNVIDTLSARTAGVLAHRTLKELFERLEIQNRELEMQKAELTSQAAELMHQNTELEIQKNMLDEASRLKTNFLSNMSHELRTPLNSVIALSGVLNRRLAKRIPDEEYSYLEVIERNGKHLLSLINDILDIARIESGRQDVAASRFDANVVIGEVVGMIRPQAAMKNIDLHYAGNGTELFMFSDAAKLKQIMQNLIGNAVKFTEKGSVVVASRDGSDTVSITVADTGIGITSEQLPHIFDEFRQADESTSRRFGGTGLGLAIAKRLTGLIGGTLSVTSVPGEGSVFTLTLPAVLVDKRGFPATEAPEAPIHAPVIDAPPSSLQSSGKTILLVEDSEPAIVQMKDILEECGYGIHVARDGAEGLAFIAHTIPDAMILDLTMPGIDGFQVLRTLREAEPTAHIPVLILTAKHITKDELKFLKRNNIHQLIQKGDINRNELQQAVAGMVSAGKAEPAKPKAKRRRTIEGKPLVLVAEDNPDNLLTVKALLGDRFTVIDAMSGSECIEKAKAHKPHLILMDIALPGLDGIGAFKALRQDAELQLIPVIALTASAMTHDRAAILAYGFDAYITKPIEEVLFFTTISEVLHEG